MKWEKYTQIPPSSSRGDSKANEIYNDLTGKGLNSYDLLLLLSGDKWLSDTYGDLEEGVLDDIRMIAEEKFTLKDLANAVEDLDLKQALTELNDNPDNQVLIQKCALLMCNIASNIAIQDEMDFSSLNWQGVLKILLRPVELKGSPLNLFPETLKHDINQEFSASTTDITQEVLNGLLFAVDLDMQAEILVSTALKRGFKAGEDFKNNVSHTNEFEKVIKEALGLRPDVTLGITATSDLAKKIESLLWDSLNKKGVSENSKSEPMTFHDIGNEYPDIKPITHRLQMMLTNGLHKYRNAWRNDIERLAHFLVIEARKNGDIENVDDVFKALKIQLSPWLQGMLEPFIQECVVIPSGEVGSVMKASNLSASSVKRTGSFKFFNRAVSSLEHLGVLKYLPLIDQKSEQNNHNKSLTLEFATELNTLNESIKQCDNSLNAGQELSGDKVVEYLKLNEARTVMGVIAACLNAQKKLSNVVRINDLKRDIGLLISSFNERNSRLRDRVAKDAYPETVISELAGDVAAYTLIFMIIAKTGYLEALSELPMDTIETLGDLLLSAALDLYKKSPTLSNYNILCNNLDKYLMLLKLLGVELDKMPQSVQNAIKFINLNSIKAENYPFLVEIVILKEEIAQSANQGELKRQKTTPELLSPSEQMDALNNNKIFNFCEQQVKYLKSSPTWKGNADFSADRGDVNKNHIRRTLLGILSTLSQTHWAAQAGSVIGSSVPSTQVRDAQSPYTGLLDVFKMLSKHVPFAGGALGGAAGLIQYITDLKATVDGRTKLGALINFLYDNDRNGSELNNDKIEYILKKLSEMGIITHIGSIEERNEQPKGPKEKILDLTKKAFVGVKRGGILGGVMNVMSPITNQRAACDALLGAFFKQFIEYTHTHPIGKTDWKAHIDKFFASLGVQASLGESVGFVPKHDEHAALSDKMALVNGSFSRVIDKFNEYRMSAGLPTFNKPEVRREDLGDSENSQCIVILELSKSVTFTSDVCTECINAAAKKAGFTSEDCRVEKKRYWSSGNNNFFIHFSDNALKSENLEVFLQSLEESVNAAVKRKMKSKSCFSACFGCFGKKSKHNKVAPSFVQHESYNNKERNSDEKFVVKIPPKEGLRHAKTLEGRSAAI